MTIRAPHVALLDLRAHDRPSLGNHKYPDILTFGRAIAVVELQRDDVVLATGDTWVRTQIRTKKVPVLRSAAANSFNLAGNVFGPIPEVMRSAICRMTRAAVGLSCAERLASKGKRRDGLEEPAPNAEAKRFVGVWNLD